MIPNPNFRISTNYVKKIVTKPNIRLLCSLHLIDPSTILSKQLSIDTTLLESALKLKKFKGDTFRANEDIIQP